MESYLGKFPLVLFC
ncbi:hypothetical protein LINPERPRIM_LOCUS26769 [Linum perenne]